MTDTYQEVQGLLILLFLFIDYCFPHFAPSTNTIYISLRPLHITSDSSKPKLLFVNFFQSLYKPWLYESLVFHAVNFSDPIFLWLLSSSILNYVHLQ